MTSADRICCHDFSRTTLSRRTLLKVGGLGLLGLSQSYLLRAEATGQARTATAKSVILLFQFGGASHIDTFDPKPQAPQGIRGEFGVIDTSIPGRQITEHLPRLAQLADKYALVHGVHHNSSSHNPGAYVSLTGRESLVDIVTLNASANDFPHPGSIVDHLQPGRRDVPTFVSLPTMIADGPFRTPGEFAGFLGKKHDPLWVLKDPNAKNFGIEELSLPDGIDVERISDRREALQELNALSSLAERTADVRGMDEYQQRAIDLVTSPRTKQAFAIGEEPDQLRDRYGRNRYGQSVLLARRLVEAGVSLVQVNWFRGPDEPPDAPCWDSHANESQRLKTVLAPAFDQALSALLEDLQQRGLLDEVLVACLAEFGRTPHFNARAGRDHWGSVFSVALAGGGVRGGQVYGASDVLGAQPDSGRVLPEDLTATILHCLGYAPQAEIRDGLGRPLPASRGEVLQRIL